MATLMTQPLGWMRHKRVLYATRGKLALHKCTWILINWVWDNGVATMAKFGLEAQHNNGEHDKLVIDQSETKEKFTISLLNPSQGYRTLGIWVAAVGNQRKKFKVLQISVDRWLTSIKQISLSNQDKQLMYTAF